VIHIDDGLFEWYEDITTRLVIYDFELNEEIIPELPYENPHTPRFRTDDKFCFIAPDSSGGDGKLHLYNMEPGLVTECFEITGDAYCPYDNGLIMYDWRSGKMEYVIPGKKLVDILFDNKSLLTFKRPLSMIQNISACNGVLMFEAGMYSGKVGKSVYSMPVAGGIPEIKPTGQKTWTADGAFNPAVYDSNEFAYIYGDEDESDIYYYKDDKIYRLTFDGGRKYYLAISTDGLRIAYSYMIERDGMESFEIFMLDFTMDATVEDINYRISSLR
jgi:hypothetical protein